MRARKPCSWPRRAAFLLLVVPMLALSQFGIPGVPTLVYDPTQAAHVITEITRIVQLYNMATQTYNQIAYSAGWTPVKTPWLGVATPIVLSTTQTVFGETAAWNPAVTTGVGIPPAWSEATYGINPPPFYAGWPIGASSISANIASINVADGMSQAAMQTISNSRSNQPMNDLALSHLETSAQDTTLNTNSEVEQLNQISGSNVLANRQAEDANALLTTIAEQQLLMNKTTRDTLADNLNVMSVRDNYIATAPTAWGGDAAQFASYRQ
jgi:hypothetical protein